MDNCLTVSVSSGGQSSFSINKSIDKSAHLQSLVSCLRAVQSETNEKLTEIINHSNGDQGVKDNGDIDVDSLEEDEDDSDDGQIKEPAQKQPKLL